LLEEEEKVYRIYLTDALKQAVENVSKFAGGGVMSKRWFDLFKPVDNRTGDEIVADVMRNAGLKFDTGGDSSGA